MGEVWFRLRPGWDAATVAFLIVTTLLRLRQLSMLELVPDEAYYWDWSRRLALGYYDQGPMIAYVIRATTALFGTTEFGVRFGVLAASLGTLLCCWALARRWFSPLTGFLTVVFLGLTPLMEIGSLIATYDPLLVLFWALALVCLQNALFDSNLRAQRRGWLAAGVATGLGFLSKHTMLLLAPCLLLFLFLSPRHRFWLRRPEPYAAFLLTLLLYSGVFYWNAHHHWWTFGHLLFLAAKTNSTPWRRLGDFLGSQALLLGPGLFLGALIASWAALRKGTSPNPLLRKEGANSGLPPSYGGANASSEQMSSSHEGTSPLRRGGQAATPPSPYEGEGRGGVLFLLCMGLPVFLFFCLLTFKAKVQGNWAPCAWLTLTILCAAQLSEHAQRSATAMRSTARLAAAIAALSGLLTLLVISPALRLRLGVHLPPDADLSNTAYGWRQLAAHVQQIRREMELEGRRPVFIAGNGYQYCALMAFYLPDHPETYDLFLHFRLTMYAAYVERLKQRLGQDAVFIDDGEADDRDLRQIFTQVAWEPPYPIWRRPFYKQPIRTLHIARCLGYRRYVGLQWAQGG